MSADLKRSHPVVRAALVVLYLYATLLIVGTLHDAWYFAHAADPFRLLAESERFQLGGSAEAAVQTRLREAAWTTAAFVAFMLRRRAWPFGAAAGLIGGLVLLHLVLLGTLGGDF